MILTGTNYNLKSDALEHQRLQGKGFYNESRAEHFLKLMKGGSVLSPQKKRNTMTNIMKVKPSEQQQEEMILRVKAEKERKRTGEKPTDKNVKMAVSGRSTQGINRDRKTDHKQSYAIMRANTKRQIADTPKIY
jgi:hypothetical protein